MDSRNKKIILSLLIVIIIATAVWFAFDRGLLKLKNREPIVLPPAPEFTKTDLATDKLPEIFPKDLIQEKGVEIINVSEAAVENGTRLFNLKYLTKLSPSKVFDSYMKYFIDNKWSLVGGGEKTSERSNISAMKAVGEELERVYVSSSVNNNDSSAQNVVDIIMEINSSS